jgi:hypothetical protein
MDVKRQGLDAVVGPLIQGIGFFAQSLQSGKSGDFM